MTDTEKLDLVIRKLDSVEQELKGFNGNPGLCKRVSGLEKTVRWIINTLCLAGGSGALAVGISKLIGG